MKIPLQKTKKETEEYVYKYHYGKFIKIGTLKEQQDDNTRDK